MHTHTYTTLLRILKNNNKNKELNSSKVLKIKKILINFRFIYLRFFARIFRKTFIFSKVDNSNGKYFTHFIDYFLLLLVYFLVSNFQTNKHYFLI